MHSIRKENKEKMDVIKIVKNKCSLGGWRW